MSSIPELSTTSHIPLVLPEDPQTQKNMERTIATGATGRISSSAINREISKLTVRIPRGILANTPGAPQCGPLVPTTFEKIAHVLELNEEEEKILKKCLHDSALFQILPFNQTFAVILHNQIRNLYVSLCPYINALRDAYNAGLPLGKYWNVEIEQLAENLPKRCALINGFLTTELSQIPSNAFDQIMTDILMSENFRGFKQELQTVNIYLSQKISEIQKIFNEVNKNRPLMKQQWDELDKLKQALEQIKTLMTIALKIPPLLKKEDAQCLHQKLSKRDQKLTSKWVLKNLEIIKLQSIILLMTVENKQEIYIPECIPFQPLITDLVNLKNNNHPDALLTLSTNLRKALPDIEQTIFTWQTIAELFTDKNGSVGKDGIPFIRSIIYLEVLKNYYQQAISLLDPSVKLSTPPLAAAHSIPATIPGPASPPAAFPIPASPLPPLDEPLSSSASVATETPPASSPSAPASPLPPLDAPPSPASVATETSPASSPSAPASPLPPLDEPLSSSTSVATEKSASRPIVPQAKKLPPVVVKSVRPAQNDDEKENIFRRGMRIDEVEKILQKVYGFELRRTGGSHAQFLRTFVDEDGKERKQQTTLSKHGQDIGPRTASVLNSLVSSKKNGSKNGKPN